MVQINCIKAQSTSLPFLKVEYIGLDDGLPNREILEIAQDKQGFFWIASWTGIYRYDGYQFTPLKSMANGERLLPSSNTQIFVMPDGKLLLLVDESQLFLYDPDINEVKVHPVHSITGLKVLPTCKTCIWVEKDNAFLFEMQENNKRYLMRYKEGAGLVKLDSVRYSNGQAAVVLKDSDENLFWGTPELGIRRYTPGDQLADSLKLPASGLQNTPALLNEFCIDASGRLLVQDSGQKVLIEWDWKKQRTLQTGLALLYLQNNTASDHAGNTWLLGLEQLWMLDNKGQLHDQTWFLREKSNFGALKKLIRDNQGQIWITCDNGIFQLSTSSGQFLRYMSTPQPKWAKTTRGLFEDKQGTIYFRCEKCGNEADNAIYRINKTTGGVERVPFLTDESSPDGIFEHARSYCQAPGSNVVWTVGKYGLMKLDLLARTVRIERSVNPAFVNNVASTLALRMSRKGEILAGGKLNHLFAYNPATQRLRFLIPNGVKNEEEGYISAILEASDGTIWIGLNKGLYRIDPRRGEIIQRYGIETHPVFQNQQIQLLHEDNDGSIWTGGYGGGLVHVFPETGKVEQFTTADGLSDNIVAAILPYDEDYLWIGTFNGLSCFNKKEKSFVNFYEEDGLSHNEFNFTSAFIDSKGLYYFGGMNGINAFYPEEILKPGQVSLPLLLTGFSFYDERKDTLSEQFGGLQSLREVTFSPHVSWFQLNYALASYTNPKFNKFKTWLENFEKDWTYQGTTPFIRYNRLPAGHYILHVKAADAKGYWSENELIIHITVQQVFYKTWWFILLLCLAAGAGIFVIVRFRYRQKLELERMRTRIASDLHDEVGSSLSHLNLLIGSFDINNAPERTSNAADKAKEVMSRTASNIRDVVWAIDARRDKTGDLLDRMEDFAFDMLGSRNTAYQFHTDGIRRDGTLSPFIRQNIYLIYKEAVNNIAKHSSATQVDIRLQQTGNELELTVADNGHSLNHSRVKGQGLENMQLRAARIGGKLEIRQAESGFSVLLKTPIRG